MRVRPGNQDTLMDCCGAPVNGAHVIIIREVRLMQIHRINETVFSRFGDKVTITERDSFREQSKDIEVTNLAVGEVIALLQTIYEAGRKDQLKDIVRAFNQEIQ